MTAAGYRLTLWDLAEMFLPRDIVCGMLLLSLATAPQRTARWDIQSRSAHNNAGARASTWSVVNPVWILKSCSSAFVAPEMSSETECRLGR